MRACRYEIRTYSTLLVVLFITGMRGPLLMAEEPPSAVGSMLKLLKSGRVPEQRLGTIVKLICDRGNEHDLRFIFDQVIQPDHWSADLRESALSQLATASMERKVRPVGELVQLGKLFTDANQRIRITAIDLAGTWKVEETFPALQEIATEAEVSAEVKTSALKSMSAISGEKTKALLVQQVQSDNTFAAKSAAIEILAAINIESASQLAAKTLQQASAQVDPGTLLDGFLNQESGSVLLAKAIKQTPPEADMAKLALRHMYSIGRNDQELSTVLSEIAGIAGDPKPPTKEELAQLVIEVAEQGDAARGEQVFRRTDLSCMKCHAVSKAGGQIGPDLSALGASSPADYVIMSVLDPDQAIKEAYTTRVVITTEGRIHQGIVADRTANALVLKDATGKTISIPIDDIEDEVEGKSLMPKGLVKFMTHAEFIDLAKFLTSLGKPGEYAVRSSQRMQRWRLLTQAPAALINEVPALSTFEDLVLGSNDWISVYAKVNGELPLDELLAREQTNVIYIQGDVNVSKAGGIKLQLSDSRGIEIWVNDEQLPMTELRGADFSVGIQKITLRVDITKRDNPFVKLELTRDANSEAQFAVVDGS